MFRFPPRLAHHTHVDACHILSKAFALLRIPNTCPLLIVIYEQQRVLRQWFQDASGVSVKINVLTLVTDREASMVCTGDSSHHQHDQRSSHYSASIEYRTAAKSGQANARKHEHEDFGCIQNRWYRP